MHEAITEPVDAVLSLVVASDGDLAHVVGLIRPGGVIVTTATASAGDPDRDVRSEQLFVRSDRDQLAHLAELIDDGRLRVDVSETHPLADIALVHARGEAGKLRGKVLLLPGA